MRILVLDVGSSSARGVVYDEAGRKHASAQVENREVFGLDGAVTEPASDWTDHVLQILHCLSSDIDLKHIAALALTAQRSSVIPVDRDGRALMDTVMWQDTRNAALCQKLSRDNEKIFSVTGSKVSQEPKGTGEEPPGLKVEGPPRRAWSRAQPKQRPRSPRPGVQGVQGIGG